MNSSILFDLQVTQMKYRLAEGNGECFYFIGESLLTAHRICSCSSGTKLHLSFCFIYQRCVFFKG